MHFKFRILNSSFFQILCQLNCSRCFEDFTVYNYWSFLDSAKQSFTVKLVGVGYQKTWDILGGTGVILGGNSMFELFLSDNFGNYTIAIW